ncbi:MAG: DNA-binding protein [Cycloclasticus sp. symbiont of Poecilosclerida sp. N]|nr:MAG: DNA-binding protein [Cycloclasticus sp. symbiont of Poecilosclerida sp. N]
MKKNQQITINNTSINVARTSESDYVSLTDMLKEKDGEFFISDWLRNRNTIEFLGVWEQMHNQDFNYGEFAIIKSKVGLNSYKISIKEWSEKTNSIGLTAKTGRYGGTYAHQDIAFEFASWISPIFKLLLIKEFQRLKEIESNEHNLDWNVKRLISKTNYKLQTEAIKNYIIPKSVLAANMQGIEYANEAEVINMAVFSYTSKQWKQQNPKAVLNNENIRDIASINELAVLSTLEAMNSNMIKQGVDRHERLNALREMAQDQLSTLNRMSDDEKSLKKIGESVYIQNKQNSDFDKSLKQAIDHNPKD